MFKLFNWSRKAIGFLNKFKSYIIAIFDIIEYADKRISDVIQEKTNQQPTQTTEEDAINSR